jgi:hypothetical protein
MKKATFHEDADAEMMEAARFYEERSSGLGFSFHTALYSPRNMIEFESWPLRTSNVALNTGAIGLQRNNSENM